MVKQDMARLNTDILGISGQKRANLIQMKNIPSTEENNPLKEAKYAS